MIDAPLSAAKVVMSSITQTLLPLGEAGVWPWWMFQCITVNESAVEDAE